MIDTIALERALTSLPDDQLHQFEIDMGAMAAEAFGQDDDRIGHVLHALAVISAEERDHRAELTEAARQALDGDDVGGRVDPADIPAMLDDARREMRSDPPDA